MKISVSRISLSHKWYELENEVVSILNEQQRKSLAVICYYIHNQNQK